MTKGTKKHDPNLRKIHFQMESESGKMIIMYEAIAWDLFQISFKYPNYSAVQIIRALIQKLVYINNEQLTFEQVDSMKLSDYTKLTNILNEMINTSK